MHGCHGGDFNDRDQIFKYYIYIIHPKLCLTYMQACDDGIGKLNERIISHSNRVRDFGVGKGRLRTKGSITWEQ